MRADRRRGAGDRPQQASVRRGGLRPRSHDGHRGARHRARRTERVAATAWSVVPGRCQYVGTGDHWRDGRQQLLRLALDRLRQHGAQRDRRRGAAGGRHRCPAGAGGADDGAVPTAARADERPALDRRARARRDRTPGAESDAARRRLQPRRVPSPERTAVHRGRQRQLLAPAGRQRRHARVDAHADAEARAAAQASRARGGQLPDAVSGDGTDQEHRHAGPLCGRTRRPHDDRTGPQQPGVPACHRRCAGRRARRDPAGGVHRRRHRSPAPQATWWR
jgi:hypothetical protein